MATPSARVSCCSAFWRRRRSSAPSPWDRASWKSAPASHLCEGNGRRLLDYTARQKHKAHRRACTAIPPTKRSFGRWCSERSVRWAPMLLPSPKRTAAASRMKPRSPKPPACLPRALVVDNRRIERVWYGQPRLLWRDADRVLERANDRCVVVAVEGGIVTRLSTTSARRSRVVTLGVGLKFYALELVIAVAQLPFDLLGTGVALEYQRLLIDRYPYARADREQIDIRSRRAKGCRPALAESRHVVTRSARRKCDGRRSHNNDRFHWIPPRESRRKVTRGPRAAQCHIYVAAYPTVRWRSEIRTQSRCGRRRRCRFVPAGSCPVRARRLRPA